MTDKLTTAEELRKRLFKLIYTAEERPKDDDNASLIAEIEIRDCQSQTLEVAAGVCGINQKEYHRTNCRTEHEYLSVIKAFDIDAKAIRALKEE